MPLFWKLYRFVPLFWNSIGLKLSYAWSKFIKKKKKLHGAQVHGAQVPFKFHGTYKNKKKKKLHENAVIGF